MYIANGSILGFHASGPAFDVEIDGTGKFLIPGIIDSNLHVDSIPIPERLTSCGVTTVVNMAYYN